MPVVVRELVIKAVVEEGAAAANSGGPAASMRAVQDQEQLIAACVEQVLEILEKSKDR